MGLYYYCKMKRCYVCTEVKEECEFYWDDSEKTRLSSKCKKCSNGRRRDKVRTTPILRLMCNLKRRIRERVNMAGFIKINLSNEILGTDRDGLKLYFEKRFRDGMVWENYGSHWVVDHMLPMNEVDTYEDLVRLCHYTNLQPLLVKENLSKGNKLTTESLVKKEFPYNEIMVDKGDKIVDIKISGNKSVGFFWSDESPM